MTEMTMDMTTESGSKSGAEVCVDIPGTCEGLPLSDKRNRIWVKPEEQHPGHRKVSFPCDVAKKKGESEYDTSSRRQEILDGETVGRLSRLIVAIESWETLAGRSQ